MVIREIGKKIRNLRIAADLTQDELATRAGLTDGFISQVERGLTSISVDSLAMILTALNVTFEEFFRQTEPHRVIFGLADQVEIEAEAPGAGSVKLLVPGATNRRMEPALLTLEVGASSEVRTSYQGDYYGYVLKGRVNLHFGSELYRAKAGESFYITADREHHISNPGSRVAVVLWISSPPSF